jgi:hypothetical protein
MVLQVVRVISGICFHVMLHVGLGQISEARQAALTAFNTMNQSQQIVSSLQYTFVITLSVIEIMPQFILLTQHVFVKNSQGLHAHGIAVSAPSR